MAVTPINRTMEDCDKYVQAQSMSRRWSALGPACIAALRNPTWFERTTVGAVGVNICRACTRITASVQGRGHMEWRDCHMYCCYFMCGAMEQGREGGREGGGREEGGGEGGGGREGGGRGGGREEGERNNHEMHLSGPGGNHETDLINMCIIGRRQTCSRLNSGCKYQEHHSNLFLAKSPRRSKQQNP